MLHASADLVEVNALGFQLSASHLCELLVQVTAPIAKNYSLQKSGTGGAWGSSGGYEFAWDKISTQSGSRMGMLALTLNILVDILITCR